MEAIEEAQKLDRHSVQDRAAEQFGSERIVDRIITAVNKARRDWQGAYHAENEVTAKHTTTAVEVTPSSCLRVRPHICGLQVLGKNSYR
jgi:hypothetical protein